LASTKALSGPPGGHQLGDVLCDADGAPCSSHAVKKRRLRARESTQLGLPACAPEMIHQARLRRFVVLEASDTACDIGAGQLLLCDSPKSQAVDRVPVEPGCHPRACQFL